MTISVAGKDETSDLGRDLKSLIDSRGVDEQASTPEALKLGEARNESEYSEEHLHQLRTRCGVDTASFAVPGTGVVRLVRTVLWKMLRPVFDWLTHDQNNINEQVVHALESEKRERDRQLLDLKKEIESLKKKT